MVMKTVEGRQDSSSVIETDKEPRQSAGQNYFYLYQVFFLLMH